MFLLAVVCLAVAASALPVSEDPAKYSTYVIPYPEYQSLRLFHHRPYQFIPIHPNPFVKVEEPKKEYLESEKPIEELEKHDEIKIDGEQKEDFEDKDKLEKKGEEEKLEMEPKIIKYTYPAGTYPASTYPIGAYPTRNGFVTDLLTMLLSSLGLGGLNLPLPIIPMPPMSPMPPMPQAPAETPSGRYPYAIYGSEPFIK